MEIVTYTLRYTLLMLLSVCTVIPTVASAQLSWRKVQGRVGSDRINAMQGSALYMVEAVRASQGYQASALLSTSRGLKLVCAMQEAPEAVQKKANCIIGKDYPHPIVDHKEASERCKDRMKAAYDANKKGEMPDGKKIKSPPTSPQKGSAKKQKKIG